MERRRLWLLVGLAFLVGALAGAALLFEGAAPILGGSAGKDLLVRVSNEGRAANVTVETRAVDGGRTFTWSWTLPDGTEQTARYVGPDGQTAVTVRVEWSEGARSARGDASYLVHASDCPGQDTLLRVLARTANGVSIARDGAPRCV